MELIPRAFVAGLFSPMLLGVSAVNRARINRAWAEITSTYAYRQLEIAPISYIALWNGDSNGPDPNGQTYVDVDLP